jgi:acyl carrier protein
MRDRSIEKVAALVAEALGVPAATVNAGSSIDNLPEWDSEAHMDICLAFESRFGIALDMDAIGRMTSVRALASLVDKAGA